jgi:hypothetical protein
MQTLPLRADPFALLINPEEVVAAMQGSDRLHGLSRRVCRPLDRPLIPRRGKDVAEYDNAIDAEAEPESVLDDEAEDGGAH